MLDFKPVYSSIVSKIDFYKNVNKPLNKDVKRLYQCHIDTHIWAYICKRLDPVFAVSIISRFSSNLTLEHIVAVQELY